MNSQQSFRGPAESLYEFRLKTISIRPNFGKRRALRLAGSSIVVIVMLKTQPNKILESMVITIVVQMRNLPFAYFVPVIQEDT